MPQSNEAHAPQLLGLCSGACALRQEELLQREARAPQVAPLAAATKTQHK